MFKSVIHPTPLYDSETWAPIATHLKCLQGFIMKCVWIILGVTRWDEKRNTDLRVAAGLERVEVVMLKRRLRWLGHVAWMEEICIHKCLLVCKPAGSRHPVGGQKR